MSGMKKIKCPKCKKGKMEMFGVTDRGSYKYACPKCYHKIEKGTRYTAP